ncbi:hypothetical protein PG991_015375 [Apiospora marii]|uniref:Rhodopsin domain-containing protein n=1 Tax=Apiospora marii TaxID=335849 RepID=A0ABR1R1G2_9PEZI
MADATVIYMGEPPNEEDRWAAWSREGLMQGIGALTMTLATIACALRVYARTRLIRQKLLLDDFNVQRELTENSRIGKQFTLGLAASYILSSEVAKISILMFYFRISPDKRFHFAVGGMIGILSIYSALYILLNIFGCMPISDAWNVAKQAAGEAKCIDKGQFYLAAVVVNVAIDFIILLLPIPVIAPLQMPLRRKISLCLLFRNRCTIFAATYNSVLTIKLFASDDYNWELSKELLWMYAELASCVICASGPTLKPVFTLVIFPRLGIRSSSSRAGYREHQDESSGPSYNKQGHGGGGGDLKTIGSIASKPKSKSRRPAPHDGAIELESEDDDLSIRREPLRESNTAGTTDDQARLWSRVANHGRDHSSQNFQVTSLGHDVDALDPDDGRWKGSGLDRRNSTGINVTREVNVAYDSAKPLSHV